MKEKNEPYCQEVARVGMKKELAGLKLFIDKEPSEILFINGPKSSGKPRCYTNSWNKSKINKN